jgi:hypothetical protein
MAGRMGGPAMRHSGSFAGALALRGLSAGGCATVGTLRGALIGNALESPRPKALLTTVIGCCAPLHLAYSLLGDWCLGCWSLRCCLGLLCHGFLLVV